MDSIKSGQSDATDYDVMVLLRSVADRNGFGHFMVAAPVDPSSTSLRDIVRVTTWPAELVAKYDAAELLETSRPAYEASGTALPFWWDFDSGNAAAVRKDGGSDPATSELVKAIFLEHDMPRHLSFCLADGDGRRWVVSFSGTCARPVQKEEALMLTNALQAIEMLRAIDEQAAMDKELLTDRQQEVLEWIAEGKSSGEIGTILEISERTVDGHANDACGRLNAVNRTQAVATAVRRGII